MYLKIPEILVFARFSFFLICTSLVGFIQIKWNIYFVRFGTGYFIVYLS